jgi:hypothetical protein
MRTLGTDNKLGRDEISVSKNEEVSKNLFSRVLLVSSSSLACGGFEHVNNINKMNIRYICKQLLINN